MRLVIFCHSLISDWNHGNAHFLRGLVTELQLRGKQVEVYEPRDAWSVQNLIADAGEGAIERFHEAYPKLKSHRYDLATLDLDEVLSEADAVLVHEWSDHALVAQIGEYRRTHPHFVLLFHDTHHRAVTDREAMSGYDLRHYDGVLAFGKVIRDLYVREGWTKRAWTFHEAADTRVFKPLEPDRHDGDLVWIGNWGDDERTRELHEFLIDPVAELGLTARIHGVRYPDSAKAALSEAGIEYAGWLPNFEVPRVFSRFSVTVHVPRGPYVKALPGIPTIRPFEAMACGIPLVSAPWDDAEGLFMPGIDYLVAKNGAEMKAHLREILRNPKLAESLRDHGLREIERRHTCAHRVDELLDIIEELNAVKAMESRHLQRYAIDESTPLEGFAT